MLSRSFIGSKREEAYSSTVMVLFLSRSSAWVAVKLYNRGTMVDNGRRGDGRQGQIRRRLNKMFSQMREDIWVKIPSGPAVVCYEEERIQDHKSQSHMVW